MDQQTDVDAAARGDGAAFQRLVEPLRRPLQSFIARSVTHPADAEDLYQETLIKAHKGLSTFRGDASFKTWIFSIAARTCMDHLRSRKRWRVETQLDGQQAMYDCPELLERTAAVNAQPDFSYSIREHIAFCFSCVARVLSPEQQAAVFLREVFDFGNRDASKMLGMSESVFRHHLSAARRTMQDAFEQLCSLIGKQGACYQCRQLRELTPEGKRGDDLERIGDEHAAAEQLLEERLTIVREADLLGGPSNKLHDLFFEFMTSVEEGRPFPA